MDRRRVSRVAAEAGSCWLLKNAHITRGGDIERRKKFVSTFSLPTGTKGFLVVRSTLYVFGAGADPGVPAGVTYQRLQHPTDAGATITKIEAAAAFDGRAYAIATFSDGNTYHYYGGARVTDWDTLAQNIGSNAAVAEALAGEIDTSMAVSASASSETVTITSSVPGTAFTIGKSTVNGGAVNDQDIVLTQTQANAAAVPEVRATAAIEVTGGSSDPGINEIASITIDGVDVLGSAVNWATSNAATATAVADQINAHTSNPDYSAAAVGTVVTVTAGAGTGATPNSYAVVVNEGGDVTTSHPATMAGGVTAVPAQAQTYTAVVTGTFEAADTFTVTVNGASYTVTARATGTGQTALPFRSKVYSTAGANLYFSGLNNASKWVQGEGVFDPGFINMSAQNEGQEELTAIAEYQGFMAIFSQNNVRIWSIVEDSDLNLAIQTVEAVGTRSPRSVRPYGTDDVFFLAETGVRSLKARDSSNNAYVNDVGTALDTFIREYLSGLTEDQVGAAVSIIEPLDGRYWLSVGRRIFVFSYFPAAKISAWSYYDVADDVGSDVTELQKLGNSIFARAGDIIYRYGGTNNATYPDAGEVEVEVGLPYIHANQPATGKLLLGYDVLCSNQWDLFVLPRLDDDAVETKAGVVTEVTYGKPMHEVPGDSTAFALKLVCNRAGPATVSAVALHYEPGQAG